jgi:phosphoribosylformylglycinamidine synthase subunit PurL
VVHRRKAGRPPRLHCQKERAAQRAVQRLIRAGTLRSAHDCSEGGLGVALAEACFSGEARLGARLQVHAPALRDDQVLFNESQSRIIASVAPARLEEAMRLAGEDGVPVHRLGEVGGSALAIWVNGRDYRWDLEPIFNSWYLSIARSMTSPSGGARP